MVVKERDPAKLLQLVEQLNAALASNDQSLKAKRDNPYLSIRADSAPSFLNRCILVSAADFGTFQFFDSARDELRMVTCQGFGSELAQHFDTVRLDNNCACGTALKKRSRVIVSDVTSDPIFNEHSRGVLIRANARSVQSTPIFGTSGELIGVVSTHSNKPHTFSAEDLLRLDGIVSEFVAELRRR
jgi:GAF domain-containing protein